MSTTILQLPNVQSLVVGGDGRMMPAWAKFLREMVNQTNAECAPGRISPFYLSSADMADETKFVQSGDTAGLGVGRYLGWALCNGNNGTPVDEAQQVSDSWHTIGDTGEPAFENSWVNYGSSNFDAAFRMRPDGVVVIRGIIKSGTLTAAAFTLPVGYRPLSPVRKAAMCNDGASNVAGYLYITSNGSVIPYSPGNVWFDLHDCSFEASGFSPSFVSLMRV